MLHCRLVLYMLLMQVKVPGKLIFILICSAVPISPPHQGRKKIQAPNNNVESKGDSQQPAVLPLLDIAKDLIISNELPGENSQQSPKRFLRHPPISRKQTVSQKLLTSLKLPQSQQPVRSQQSSLQSSESLRSPASLGSLRSESNETKYPVNSLIQLPIFNASDPLCTRCLNASDERFYNRCGGRRYI